MTHTNNQPAYPVTMESKHEGAEPMAWMDSLFLSAHFDVDKPSCPTVQLSQEVVLREEINLLPKLSCHWWCHKGRKALCYSSLCPWLCILSFGPLTNGLCVWSRRRGSIHGILEPPTCPTSAEQAQTPAWMSMICRDLHFLQVWVQVCDAVKKASWEMVLKEWYYSTCETVFTYTDIAMELQLSPKSFQLVKNDYKTQSLFSLGTLPKSHSHAPCTAAPSCVSISLSS